MTNYRITAGDGWLDWARDPEVANEIAEQMIRSIRENRYGANHRFKEALFHPDNNRDGKNAHRDNDLKG